MYQVERFGPVVRIRMAPSLLGRPLLWVNAFWVDGLLIDTGCRHTVPDLMAALEHEGLRVEQLVCTHTHEDHVAGNAAVRERWGVRPRCHALGVARLAYPEAELPPYRRLAWGAVDSCPGEALGDTVETDRYRLRVLPTPGHAPDHVVLHAEQEGWLFTGDLFLSPRLNRVREPERPLHTLDSLRRVAGLEVSQLFCAHAFKVPESTAPLQAKVAYWEGLQREAAALRRQGMSMESATRRLLGGPGPQEWLSRGDLSKEHLIRGLLRCPGQQVMPGGGETLDVARPD